MSLSDTFTCLSRLPTATQVACLDAALGEPHEALQLLAFRAAVDRRGVYRPDLVVDHFAELLPAVRNEMAPAAGDFLRLARERIVAGRDPRRLAAYRLVAALGDASSCELLALGIGDPQPEVRDAVLQGLEGHLRQLLAEVRRPPPYPGAAPVLPGTVAPATWQAFGEVLRRFDGHRRKVFPALLAEFGVHGMSWLTSLVLPQRDSDLGRAFVAALQAARGPARVELLAALALERDPVGPALLQQVLRAAPDEASAFDLAEQIAALRDERLLAAVRAAREFPWLPIVLPVVSRLARAVALRLLVLVDETGLDAVRRQPLVEAFLRHADVEVQKAALVALRGLRCKGGLAAVGQVLASAAGPARRAAAELVLDLDPPDKVALLTPLLGCNDPELRRLAMREVSKVSFVRYLQRFDGMDPKAQKVAARALAKIDGQMLDRVAEEVASLEPERRLKALQIVGFLEAGADLQAPLLDLLADPDRRVRATAIRVVELAGSVEGIKVLLGALADPDRRVRANAVEAFEQLDDPRFAQMLMPFLRDGDNRVRANAAKALWNLGCAEAREVLLEMLSDDDEAMRLSAVWAIGEVRFTGAREMLVRREVDESSSKVRAKIREVLAEFAAAVGGPS